MKASEHAEPETPEPPSGARAHIGLKTLHICVRHADQRWGAANSSDFALSGSWTYSRASAGTRVIAALQ